MTISANKTTVSAGGERAHTDHHPPILGNYAVLADNGEYPIGLIVQFDAGGNLIPYTATTDMPVGVIDEPVDTGDEGSVLMLRHGTVRRDLLKVGADGDAATDADIKLLETIGIYAV